MDGQKSGFAIRCLRCGAEMMIVPGARNREVEPIGFGTSVYEEDWMTCRCGNAIEESQSFDSSTEIWKNEWLDRSV
jgi:hypothetical protein